MLVVFSWRFIDIVQFRRSSKNLFEKRVHRRTSKPDIQSLTSLGSAFFFRISLPDSVLAMVVRSRSVWDEIKCNKEIQDLSNCLYYKSLYDCTIKPNLLQLKLSLQFKISLHGYTIYLYHIINVRLFVDFNYTMIVVTPFTLLLLIIVLTSCCGFKNIIFLDVARAIKAFYSNVA